jgi:hypothetical protein
MFLFYQIYLFVDDYLNNLAIFFINFMKVNDKNQSAKILNSRSVDEDLNTFHH